MLLTLAIGDVLPATPRARIVRLDLAGSTLPYVAGQAVLVGTPSSVKRPYSIAAAPEDTRRTGYIELLVGVDASGTPGGHLTLERGRVVEVEGPLGSFVFPADPVERRFVFIAGGTGIAPLRAMLGHALALPHQQVGLFYSARNPEEFAYEEELCSLAREGRIELRQTVTRDVDQEWNGPRGRIDRALLGPLVHDPATLCFICGPPALVGEMSQLLTELGIAASRIRVEKWG